MCLDTLAGVDCSVRLSRTIAVGCARSSSWPSVYSSNAMPTKRRSAGEPTNRQAMPRSAPRPSKYPINSERELIPGGATGEFRLAGKLVGDGSVRGHRLGLLGGGAGQQGTAAQQGQIARGALLICSGQQILLGDGGGVWRGVGMLREGAWQQASPSAILNRRPGACRVDYIRAHSLIRCSNPDMCCRTLPAPHNSVLPRFADIEKHSGRICVYSGVGASNL